jgi:hypothetical protein
MHSKSSAIKCARGAAYIGECRLLERLLRIRASKVFFLRRAVDIFVSIVSVISRPYNTMAARSLDQT